VTSTTTTPDLLDPQFYGDIDAMHETFRELRATDPVHRDERNGLWGVTRHADVLDVERRDHVFSSRGAYRSMVNPDETNTIALDDPEHAAQRKLVARRFTPKAVRGMTVLIRRVVDELLDAALERGRIEVVTDLAAAFPARLTAHLLGFPEERWPDIRTWSERLMRYDAVEKDPDALMGMMTAIQEFNQLLVETAAERSACPADDLISVWTGSGMEPMTMFHETGLFISGGAETTRTVIARGIRALCDHQDQWERMAAEPKSIPIAVEEIIRWVTPLNNFFRVTTEDSTIADVPVASGDRVILLYPSANRDETVFADPYRFDTTRDPNPHVAFGFGTHFCLGASLARLELRILFEQLTQRLTNLEVVTEPDIEPNIFVGAVRSFELAFGAR
jgi:cytochrome P450 family 142 subfamily A polypeptide 1